MLFGLFPNQSAENKLSFVDKLIFHKLPQKTRTKYWFQISTDLSKLIEFRNALAHFEISVFNEKEIKKLKKPISKYMWLLSRHHLDVHANKSGSIKGLTIENIEGNAHKMEIVTYMLIYFSIDHAPLTEPLLKSLPPKLQQWLDSFRKMPRPPGFEPHANHIAGNLKRQTRRPSLSGRFAGLSAAVYHLGLLCQGDSCLFSTTATLK